MTLGPHDELVSFLMKNTKLSLRGKLDDQEVIKLQSCVKDNKNEILNCVDPTMFSIVQTHIAKSRNKKDYSKI